MFPMIPLVWRAYYENRMEEMSTPAGLLEFVKLKPRRSQAANPRNAGKGVAIPNTNPIYIRNVTFLRVDFAMVYVDKTPRPGTCWVTLTMRL